MIPVAPPARLDHPPRDLVARATSIRFHRKTSRSIEVDSKGGEGFVAASKRVLLTDQAKKNISTLEMSRTTQPTNSPSFAIRFRRIRSFFPW